jgi:hypothetical protein
MNRHKLLQVTRPAIERDENDRAEYQLVIGTYYEPDQLVIVDESSFDRRVSHRPYAWAPTGSRARRRDFFIRGKWCKACETVCPYSAHMFSPDTPSYLLYHWMGY